MSKPFVRVFAPLGLTAAISVGGGGGASAQTATNTSVTAPSPVSSAISKAEEIVVTASRRREKVQDVPSTVTVLGAKQLQSLNASSQEDYLGQIPGVTTFGVAQGNQQIIFRGITSSGNQQSATVGTYVDDVAIGSSTADSVGARAKPDLNVFDLSRIEVLKGPQGTLYGSNTLGGLLKYVTVQPDPQGGFTGAAKEEGTASGNGQFGYGFDAAANIPLGDTAAIRISGTDNYRPGYVDNIGLGNKNQNWSDVFGGRIALLWKPIGRLTIRGQALTQRTADGGESTVDINLQSGMPLYGPFIQNRLTQQREDQKFQLYSISLDYDLDGITLSSITSYNHIGTSQQTDYSGYDGHIAPDQPLAFDNFQTQTNKFTQEFRLSSSATDRFSYIIGGLYTQEDALLKDSEFGWKAVNVIAPDVGLIYGAYAPALYRQFAAYGDATYRFTPALDLTFGIRYSHDHDSSTSYGSGIYGAALPQSQTSSDSVVNFLITPRWFITKDQMVYFRAASGFRPGGPNFVPTFAIAAGAKASFQPDSLWNYEVGLKSNYFDSRLQIDIDAFYIDWSNIQVRSAVDGYYFQGNGGSARSQGGEAALTYRPLHNWSIGVGTAYTDAHLAADALSVGGVNGAELPNVAKWTLNGTTDYTIPIKDNLVADLGADFNYLGSRQADFNQDFSPRLKLPAYTVVDLRAVVRWKASELHFCVNNVANKRGIETVTTNFIPASEGVIRPRTFGLALTQKF
jgi:outer membrane receptor protein involved in Fe transport